jgi:hypothetical protein
MRLIFIACLLLTATGVFAQGSSGIIEITDEGQEDTVDPINAPPTEAAAEAPPEFRDAGERAGPFGPLKNHWIVTFGGEQLDYELPLDYQGAYQKFPTKKFPNSRILSGGRVGLGKEYVLANKLLASTKVDGYFLGTLFAQAQTGSPGADIDISQTKRTGQIFGLEVSQSIGFSRPFSFRHLLLDEMSFLRFEPFVEAALGMARAFNKIEYFDVRNGRQEYEHRFTDKLLNTRLSIGFNLTSVQNYFMYAKASANKFVITDRQIHRQEMEDGTLTVDPVRNDSDADMGIVMSYAIGGGYKF